MTKKLISLMMAILFLPIPMGVAAQTEIIDIYVAINGSDNANGTVNAPFKTLQRAQQKARQLNKNMTGDITISVGEGTYFLEEPFMITDEDSGSNGYNVIYKGNNALISGGKRISGFKQYDGDVYCLSLGQDFDDKKIGGLYVDGVETEMAHNRELFKAYSLSNDKKGRYGLEAENDELFNLKTPKEAFIQYGWAWRNSIGVIDGIGISNNGKPVIIEKYETVARSAPEPEICYTFTMWNDYSLMEQPGDFCYDSKNKVLYYKKPQSINVEESEFIVPYLEEVFEIKGENSENKVKNIKIEGFTFSHTQDDTALKGGYRNDQSIQLAYNEKATDYQDMQTASVQLCNADNVVIRDNTFSNSRKVGLGAYEGVTNCTIDGNIFTNLASSALSMGLAAHRWVRDYDYKMTNVAYRKPATTSNDTEGKEAWKLVDEYNDTGLGITGSDEVYIKIDLLDEYTINRVETEFMPEACNSDFEVFASNQENFLEYKKIASCSVNKAEFDETYSWHEDVENKQKFRYVKFVFKNSSSALFDVRIFTKDLGNIISTAICSGNNITNNIVNHVSTFLITAAAMSIFYVADTNVCNNEIYDCSYTGISIGWGWNRSLTKTMKNNRVVENFIVGSMQKGFDGGGIYSLGAQSNEEISGNYIKDMGSHYAAIYPDNGATDILITKNVVENVPEGYFPYSADQSNLRVEDNYASTSACTLGAKNSYIKNTKLFVRDHMPEEVKQYANRAGTKYDQLRERAGVDRNTTKFEDVYKSADDLNMVAYAKRKTGVMKEYIEEGETLIKIAKNSGLINLSNRGILNDFEHVVEMAKIQTLSEKFKDAEPTDELLSQQAFYLTGEFRRKVKEFANSGIFTDDNYKMVVLNVVPEETVLPNTRDEAELYWDSEFSTDIIFTDTDKLKQQHSVKFDSDKITFSNINEGVYTKYIFDNVKIHTKTMIDLKSLLYQGFVIRSSHSEDFLSEADCYIVCFKPNAIELQRFNKGKQNYIYDDLPVDSFKFGEANDVVITTENTDGGVRIAMEINSKPVFDYLDNSSNAVREPGFFGYLAPSAISMCRISEDISVFSDMAGYAWAEETINNMYMKKIISGVGNGKFLPGESITRADASIVLSRAFNLADTYDDTHYYDDIEGYYELPIRKLAALKAYDGVFEGADFRPGLPIKRIELASIIYNMLVKFGYDTQADEYEFSDLFELTTKQRNAISLLKKLGIMQGCGNDMFEADRDVTRAEISFIANAILNLGE